MPFYSYAPDEFESRRSDHDSDEAYRTRSGGARRPFPEDDYMLDAEGNHTRYEPAEATFTPAALGAYAHTTYDALIALGATAAVGSYDGGGDELYNRLDRITVGDAEWDREQARAHLADTPAGDNPADHDAHWSHSRHYFEPMPRPYRAGYALDALASAFSDLLGVYGIGGFEVRGAFRVDFRAGTVVDVPQPL